VHVFAFAYRKRMKNADPRGQSAERIDGGHFRRELVFAGLYSFPEARDFTQKDEITFIGNLNHTPRLQCFGELLRALAFLYFYNDILGVWSAQRRKRENGEFGSEKAPARDDYKEESTYEKALQFSIHSNDSRGNFPLRIGVESVRSMVIRTFRSKPNPIR